MTETQNLLTVEMAAQYLHCHPETVRRMIRRGDLRAVKFRKFWRVPMEGLRRVENAALDAPVSTPVAKSLDNPLTRALAMVQARDASAPTRLMRTADVDDAASEIRAMREEQTP